MTAPMALLSGTTLDQYFILALGLVVAALGFVVLRQSPKLALGFALVVLCFVPIWVGIRVGPNGNLFLPIASGVAVLVSAAIVRSRGFRFSVVDALLAFLILVAASALFIGNESVALAFFITPFSYFVSGYVLSRVASHRIDVTWIYGAVSVIFSAVAVMAIIEFTTGWNPFILLKVNNSLFGEWGELQERGGVLRAEGAFGHSIALGSCLAMAIPLSLASRFRFSLRVATVIVIFVATVLTFSRIGIVGAALGLVLSVVFLKDVGTPVMRATLGVAAVVTAVTLYPAVARVFDEAGDEASRSAEYRGDLLPLLGDMNLIGVSDLVHQTSNGRLYFRNFESIDSQLILTGLTNGTIALAGIVVTLVGAVILSLRGKANAATIAVVAQIPAFTSVALITQYSIFLWFVIGLAAAGQVRKAAEPSEPPAQFALKQRGWNGQAIGQH